MCDDNKDIIDLVEMVSSKYLKEQLLGVCAHTKKVWEAEHKDEASILRWWLCSLDVEVMMDSNSERDWVETLLDGYNAYPHELDEIVDDIINALGGEARAEEMEKSLADTIVLRFISFIVPLDEQMISNVE
jgi:hypothetical protein